MRKRYKKIILGCVLVLSVSSLTACGKKEEKSPFDEKNAELGEFNASGYQSNVLGEKDLTHISDAFIKKYVSRLVDIEYEVFDVEEVKVDIKQSLYGEDSAYTIYIKDLPEIKIYKFEKDSETLELISHTNRLEPVANLGTKSNAVIFDRYVLATDTATEDAVGIFKKMGGTK